jgi:hypothetical protein
LVHKCGGDSTDKWDAKFAHSHNSINTEDNIDRDKLNKMYIYDFFIKVAIRRSNRGEKR